MITTALSRSIVPFTLLLSICSAQDDPAPRLQAHVYDVRDLVHNEAQYRPATAIEASFVPTASEVMDDPVCAMEIGDLVSLLQETTSPEYWGREGVAVQPEDSGYLSVMCDEAMHARVRRTLDEVRAMLFETVLVEVHELPGAVLAGRPSVLSGAELDAVLAQAGEHPVHFGRTNVRQPLLLESKRTQNRIAGLRARVAQGAAAPDPLVATDAFGASWSVQAMRTIGDAFLVSVTGSDRALEKGAMARRVPTSAVDGAAALELAATRIATCHASAYLKPGQAMLVGTNAANGKALCVRIGRAGAPTGKRIGAARVFPVTALVTGVQPPARIAIPGSETALFPVCHEEPMPAVYDVGRLMELISSLVDPERWDGAPNTMHTNVGYLFVCADEQVDADVEALLGRLQELDKQQYSLEVRFGEVGGGALQAGAAELVDALPQLCVTTVSPSRFAQVSGTRHTPFIRGYAASLAQDMSATAPELDSSAEGFLMRGRVVASGEGTVRLDLHLTVLARGPEAEPFDLGHPRLGPIDRVDVRENKVRGAASVELGQWTLLHVSPVEGTASHLAVVARVQRL